jgi:fibro-slime domain-containing protein
MKTSHPYITATTYSILGIAVGVAYILPPSIMPMSSAKAATPTGSVQLTGTLRDFLDTHADFDVTPSSGFGHYAGNVNTTLTSENIPSFTGQYIGSAVNNFTMSDGEITPGDDFAIMVTVLGASLDSENGPRPVTFQIETGGSVYEPFGSYGSPVNANVNDAANPRRDVAPTIHSADSDVTITAKSWGKTSSAVSGTSDSDWQTHLVASSGSASPLIVMLRDGDAVPTLDGAFEQLSVSEHVSDYVDSSTDTMELGDNQVIILFELSTTDLSHSTADFQDLVLLVTLGTTPAYLEATTMTGDETPGMQTFGYRVNNQWTMTDGTPIAPHMAATGAPITMCTNSVQDNAGSKGSPDCGAINGSASFSQWFDDVPGVNQSMPFALELAYIGDGVFEFVSDAFFPADNQMFGNGDDFNNFYFTYTMTMDCEYSSCREQFLEVMATDDVWVFVDGQLVIDLGGVRHGQTQRIDLDRLGLTDGNTYEVRVFIAQRNDTLSELEIRTNIFLRAAQINQAYTAVFD